MTIATRKITSFTNLIADLADKPNATLTAAQLKSYWDSSPEEVRVALNGLIDDLIADYETKDDITASRKLSETGNFTGTLNGMAIVAAEPGLSTEVVGARGGELVLKDRLDKTDYLTKQLVPKRYIFGKQLEKLKESLSNPLEQYTGIVFLGDSITWGMIAMGNPIDHDTGRDGTLSDLRDNFASLSFVNNFKRYIGSKYAFNAVPTLSNWSASTAGEAITTYEKQNILHPYGGDFTYSATGTIFATSSAASAGSLSGFQLSIVIESGVAGEAIISFPFTGDNFTLSIDSIGPSSMDYELFVDGVSQGTFHTAPGGDIVAGYDQRRTHTFTYVRNKTIQIKTVKTGYVGYQGLKLGGIIINKKIRVTNQGIIGQTAKGYLAKNLTGNTSGDGVAVGAYDNYAFVQFGANDRLISTAYPKGSNEFKNSLKMLIDTITPLSDVIMMVSNPVANENPASYSFNMQDVRNVVYRIAKENSLDFIDNYSIFGDVSTAVYTADGLHPNDFGHEVISRNAINSLEFN